MSSVEKDRKGQENASSFTYPSKINKTTSEEAHQDQDKKGVLDLAGGRNTLYDASRHGNKTMVQTLLDNGADVNAKGRRYGNALQAASAGGHEEVVRILLSAGADVNTQDETYENALHAASAGGYEEVVRLLVSAGADVNAQGGHYGNALHAASAGGHEEVVRILLSAGADVNAQDEAYQNALHAASAGGHEEVVRLLVSAGADVNAKRGHYGNALHAASAGGHEEVVRILLSAGADVNEQGGHYGNALYAASAGGRGEVVRILLSAGADVNAKVGYYRNALHAASEGGHEEVVRLLVSAGIDVNAKGGDHGNALQAASAGGHEEMVRILLSAGADVNARGAHYGNALHAASAGGHEEVVRILVSAGADVNAEGRHYGNALQAASAGGHEEVVRILLSAGVDVHVQGGYYGDAFQAALNADSDHDKKIVMMLLDAAAKIDISRALSRAILTRNHHVVERFLTNNFLSVAAGEHEWLQELAEVGCSNGDMAMLLLEEDRDSPWIYFTPQDRTETGAILDNHHGHYCAHRAIYSFQAPSDPRTGRYHPHADSASRGLRKLIEELCGIGGISPFSRDLNVWPGVVKFEHHATACITYAKGPRIGGTKASHDDLISRISYVMNNLYVAIATAQSAGLCCDSFTYLALRGDHLELKVIELSILQRLRSLISALKKDIGKKDVWQACIETAELLLGDLKVAVPSRYPDKHLHYCALAIQFLCLAFLSYTQAHTGALSPFFLDTPQQEIIFLGALEWERDYAISMRAFELTCLAEMTQQPVFAFCPTVIAVGDLLQSHHQTRYDLVTNVANLLDTWGPGYLIYDRMDQLKIHAIALGEGFIVPWSDSNESVFHWAKGSIAKRLSRNGFSVETMMRIGTAISVNQACILDEIECRSSTSCALLPLGTHASFWELNEKQSGLQGGQYVIGTFTFTSQKVPGVSLKQYRLQCPEWTLLDFLNESWGLQVSFCTGVARRVTLRQLVADLFPIFARSIGQNNWQKLSDGGILQAFATENLIYWHQGLDVSLQPHVYTLVRAVLEQLRHTGFDRATSSLVIAWPQEGDLTRGLRVPCAAQTRWAEILADAEDCATFAYMTSRCLETSQVKCPGNQKAWQNKSAIMLTEVSPSRPSGEPVSSIPPNSAMNNSPSQAAVMSTSTITTADAMTQWKLLHHEYYYVKKLETVLRVRVVRPTPASADVAHLVVAPSIIPSNLLKRIWSSKDKWASRYIREKQHVQDYAELVLVRADQNI